MGGRFGGSVLIITLGELGFELGFKEGDFFFKIFKQTTRVLLVIGIRNVWK